LNDEIKEDGKDGECGWNGGKEKFTAFGGKTIRNETTWKT